MSLLMPTLIKPKALALKNRWLHHHDSKLLSRDVLLVGFVTAIVFFFFSAMRTALIKTQASIELAYVHPSTLLALIFLTLLGLLFFSSAVSALGSLYLSSDLELILSSPISKPRFFFSKLSEIFISATWMVCVFFLPVIIAFGVSYEATSLFYIHAGLLLIPYLFVPVAVSMILVTLFTSCVPANRTREVLIIVSMMVLFSGYYLFRFFESNTGYEFEIDQVLNLLALTKIPSLQWLPSHWLAMSLGETLSPRGAETMPYTLLLFSTALLLSSAAYISLRFLHSRAYSQGLSNKQTVLRTKTTIPFTKWLPSQARGISEKETKLFLRDMTQAMQLMVLLGLVMIYLYNFKILRLVGTMPGPALPWWKTFLVASNIFLGAFVVTAICTRFVFPSLSLEGKSFWILRTSPLPLETLLRTKHLAWTVPVGLLSSIVLTSGALAIDAEWHLVASTSMLSIILSYGIVGLAVGLGAYFANFDWEHTSQLAASFGSFVFMISATIFLLITMIPISLLLILRTFRIVGVEFTPLEWYACVTTCSFLIVYFNYAVARLSLALGRRALERREL